MKKTLSMIGFVAFIVLATGTFCLAEFAAAGVDNFPYFHLGALIIGGLTIISLKQRYGKIYLGEAIASFAMYTLLVTLFTAPVVDAVRNLVG